MTDEPRKETSTYAIDPEFADLLALLPAGVFDDVEVTRQGLIDDCPS